MFNKETMDICEEKLADFAIIIGNFDQRNVVVVVVVHPKSKPPLMSEPESSPPQKWFRARWQALQIPIPTSRGNWEFKLRGQTSYRIASGTPDKLTPAEIIRTPCTSTSHTHLKTPICLFSRNSGRIPQNNAYVLFARTRAKEAKVQMGHF